MNCARSDLKVPLLWSGSHRRYYMSCEGREVTNSPTQLITYEPRQRSAWQDTCKAVISGTHVSAVTNSGLVGREPLNRREAMPSITILNQFLWASAVVGLRKESTASTW